VTVTLTPVLSRTWDLDRAWSLEVYEQHDGYAGLRAALAKAPDEVTALVKASELRGAAVPASRPG
jgi:NADH-quinone oxidoreductase subunit F